jgi:hypothetical protein
VFEIENLYELELIGKPNTRNQQHINKYLAIAPEYIIYRINYVVYHNIFPVNAKTPDKPAFVKFGWGSRT